MSKYVLSPQTQRSLKNIRGYSVEKFGEAQSKLYLKQLRQAMQSAADMPLNGIARSDIKIGYYSRSIGSHIIFYRINNNRIDIIDVLHQRMDYIKYL